MEKKFRILALFGKSGAGKDTIQKWLVNNRDMHGIVSCTTRPPRENERHGIDYNFITADEFREIDSNKGFLEITKFNDWYYGTPINSLDKNKINVGVFNIQGIQQLIANNKIEILPVYINCENKTRLLRCLNREYIVNCFEICRRFLADEDDFNVSFFSLFGNNYEVYNNSYNKDDFYGILNLSLVANFIKDINN